MHIPEYKGILKKDQQNRALKIEEELNFHNRVAVFVTAPDAPVHKTPTDEFIGIDHVAPVNNNRMGFSRKSMDLHRIEIPVVTVGSENGNCICITDHVLEVMGNGNSRISRHIRVVHPDRRSGLQKEVAVPF